MKLRLPTTDLFLAGYSALVERYDLNMPLPDARLNQLLKFLQQNAGRLSKRALEKEFAKLTPEEVQQIERLYASVF
ncbi:MAG: hypothetical protein RI556_04925 [Hydrogenovibrio sp.]|uniref:hypothetical protein n=1 Tax=Hydrogenovibrio sp. TaxID=2065821 RepID=UPI0028708316|nr:hypothetical protein [Hydrogenovibrio sp.]MDR9498496.1 hypothetical protein [Hydrogenovibrio sp.]